MSERMEFRLKAESLGCAVFRLKAELHAEMTEKGSIALTKNKMVRSAALALVLAVAPVAPTATSLKAAPRAGFAVQDDKNAQADKRAQAAKKYLVPANRTSIDRRPEGGAK